MTKRISSSKIRKIRATYCARSGLWVRFGRAMLLK